MRICSCASEEVWLTIGQSPWGRLPSAVKSAILAGLDRIARIRANIAASAPVSSMAPVEVVGELWVDGLQHIDGRCYPLAHQAGFRFSVQLPASTALCSDEALLRSILLHEFCHCFWIEAEIIKALAGARSSEVVHLKDEFNNTDPYEDAARMVDPREWFSGDDAAAIIYHDDSQLKVLDHKFSELKPYLKSVTPDTTFRIDGDIWIHDQVCARMERSLRSLLV